MADVDRPEVELWAESWDAWMAFQLSYTQWRMGPCGPTGLDYTVIQRELASRGADIDESMADIRVLESAALELMLKRER